MRSAKEWQAIIAANPFPAEAKSDPGRLVMMCLRDAPSAAQVKALQAAIKGREIVRAKGKQAYFVYPDGLGRSKLTIAMIEKALRHARHRAQLEHRSQTRGAGTMRNLASVFFAIVMALAVVRPRSRCPTRSTGHVAAAKAAAGSDYAGIVTRLCTPPAPPAPRNATPAAPRRAGRARDGDVVREAGEGVRQPLLRRPDRILGVGGDDVGRHHHHRPDLRLLGRRRSRRRA